MKTKQEWAADFWQRNFMGPKAAVNDCFERLFAEIQLDALESAATLLTSNADSPTRGFEAVHKLIVELKGK